MIVVLDLGDWASSGIKPGQMAIYEDARGVKEIAYWGDVFYHCLVTDPQYPVTVLEIAGP